MAALALAAVGVWLATPSARDSAWVARRIEAAFPELAPACWPRSSSGPICPAGDLAICSRTSFTRPWRMPTGTSGARSCPSGSIAAAALANVATFALFWRCLLALP